MLTIRDECERINGRYTNAEYREKKTRRNLTLNTGPYAGACGGAFAPPIVGLKILKFAPFPRFTPPPPPPRLKVCVRAWNNQLF